jgi:hypothetical protein
MDENFCLKQFSYAEKLQHRTRPLVVDKMPYGQANIVFEAFFRFFEVSKCTCQLWFFALVLAVELHRLHRLAEELTRSNFQLHYYCAKAFLISTTTFDGQNPFQPRLKNRQQLFCQY